MCCRYYVEATPYFIELGELAVSNSAKRRSSHSEGKVVTVGEIAPGSQVPVIATSRAGKQIAYLMYWGFRSPTGSLIINARSETAAEKPMFRDPWASHRCIIPASWYYEWEHIKAPDGSKKNGAKYTIQPTGMDKVFMCGIYRIENDNPHFAILTREPGDSVRSVHDRMPLIMPENMIGEWIKPENDPADLIRYSLTDMNTEKMLREDPQISVHFDVSGKKLYITDQK